MKTVLLTGFEPFGDELINPSWEVVSRLEGVTEEGDRIVCVQLPCVFGESLQVLLAAITHYSPTLVIAVGQAGGRTDISLERIAINVDDARIPDNKGYQPIDEPVVENGPAAWFSTLPIKAIVYALQQAGIPASVSQTAGTYVCNHVMYGLLHALGDRPEVRAGFIHIPYLPQQAAKHLGSASMAVETVKRGLEIAIHTALDVEFDARIVGGTTH
ncbi:pyrrolidone-carboxylate peptidase [bacteria symbiont BFo2 of Frankliniella occidentalis]|nr:pyrrolidone-carboxylate peptidase [bacteria symbiont BFo2 of Frankliniella occidentalis]KYP94838.1 pyrrolidone-carboxylate peptidase [bacteria symbiont BFo2 of Frankliniella occidentalis]KYP96393.1 pyrrolidone-carboxylate peptidase [bacteria symbiont BFo2 of Frankliniella occidentalis]